MKTTTTNQPTTGARCSCKRGQARDNCPNCEGTGFIIDFAAIRARKTTTTPEVLAASISGSYRTPDGKAQIEWSLEPKENGPEFSASGDFNGGCGQNIDTIARAYPADEMVQRIHKVWSVYHLNGMNAGFPVQMRAIEEEKAKAVEQALALPNPERYFWNFERRELNPHTLGTVAGLKDSSFYAWACHVLKERGLYEIPMPDTDPRPLAVGDVVWWKPYGGEAGLAMVSYFDGVPYVQGFDGQDEPSNGRPSFALFETVQRVKSQRVLVRENSKAIREVESYKYGHAWVYLPIPAEVLAEIKSWSDKPAPVGSLGDHKAAEFLAVHGLKFRAPRSDTKPAPWDESGGYRPHFRVTISKGKPCTTEYTGNIRSAARLTFDFWGGVNDREASAHTVLSCIASDIGTPETFEDFCAEYGYKEDSRKALQTFNRAARFAERLRAFFTDEEQEALNEIR